MSEKFPSHLKRLAPTLSKWRQMKRRELRAAKAQFSDLRTGSMFTPAYREIVEAEKLIDLALAKCSQKEWGK